MRKIKVEPLTIEAFAPFGSFCSVTSPTGFHMGDFYRDQVLMPVAGNHSIAFSPLVMHHQDKMMVTMAEYHNSTGEGIVTMDDDIVIHVAPASPSPVPQLTKAFLVPKGTCVHLNLGTWHCGGYSVNKEESHVLIVLPERIYNNDCVVVQYDEGDQMEMEL